MVARVTLIPKTGWSSDWRIVARVTLIPKDGGGCHSHDPSRLSRLAKTVRSSRAAAAGSAATRLEQSA